MADELQALLDRIHEDGLKKAEAERQALLDKASDEAKRLIAEAKAEAERLRHEAEQSAALLQAKGEQSLRQAARDVLLSLRGELSRRVVAVARAGTVDALAGPALADLIATLVQRFVETGGREQRLEVLLSPEQQAALAAGLEKALAADLRKHVELSPVAGLKGGFRLKIAGEDVVYDFTDEALAEALSTFLSPKLAALVGGKES